MDDKITSSHFIYFWRPDRTKRFWINKKYLVVDDNGGTRKTFWRCPDPTLFINRFIHACLKVQHVGNEKDPRVFSGGGFFLHAREVSKGFVDFFWMFWWVLWKGWEFFRAVSCKMFSAVVNLLTFYRSLR